MTTDRTPAELKLREAIETEWYNGNISQEAHDRLLLPYEWSESLSARMESAAAQLAEQRSINAAILRAGLYMLLLVDEAYGTDNDNWTPGSDEATFRRYRRLLQARATTEAATEWRTQVAKEAVSAERERLLGLFDLGWRKETSDPYPDGETAAIGYAIRRVRDRLLGHREDDPECDCESCRSIAAESGEA